MEGAHLFKNTKGIPSGPQQAEDFSLDSVSSILKISKLNVWNISVLSQCCKG